MTDGKIHILASLIIMQSLDRIVYDKEGEIS